MAATNMCMKRYVDKSRRYESIKEGDEVVLSRGGHLSMKLVFICVCPCHQGDFVEERAPTLPEGYTLDNPQWQINTYRHK